jgi:hypothetical protein
MAEPEVSVRDLWPIGVISLCLPIGFQGQGRAFYSWAWDARLIKSMMVM